MSDQYSYWADLWVELSGDEGFNFEDLRVSEIRGRNFRGNFHYVYPENKKQVHIVLKAIGFWDEKAPMRNGGVSMLDVGEGVFDPRSQEERETEGK